VKTLKMSRTLDGNANLRLEIMQYDKKNNGNGSFSFL